MAASRSSRFASLYSSEGSLAGFFVGQQQEQQPHHEQDEDFLVKLGMEGGP